MLDTRRLVLKFMAVKVVEKVLLDPKVIISVSVWMIV